MYFVALWYSFMLYIQKGGEKALGKKKKKPTKAHESLSVKQLLVDALIDLIIGTLLILIDLII